MTKRSRFGCQTCKIRKVKCDETQPFCRRCTETGRRCDGPPKDKVIFLVSTRHGPPSRTPSSSSSSSTKWGSPSSGSSPSQQLSLVPDLHTDGKRALAFFIERAGPALGAELDQDFWHKSVLQLCCSNLMVRNAVLAVSTLYERPLRNPFSWPTKVETNFAEPQHQLAFRWYSHSLHGMSDVLSQTQNQEQLQLALTSCILFACVEVQQLNVVNSMSLLKCGYDLLRQDTTKALLPHTPILRDILLPVFIRQTIVFMLHGHPLPPGLLSINQKKLRPCSTPLLSLQDARTQLFLHMLDAMLLLQESHTAFEVEAMIRLQYMQRELTEDLRMWRDRFDSHVSTHPVTSPEETRVVSLLNIYYLVTVVWLVACLSPSETAYDNYSHEFISILDHAEIVLSTETTMNNVMANRTYTFEMRVIPPLYFVGWRCRVPRIRRRAVQLLKIAPAQESLFHRDVHVWALRKIIQMEEGLPSRSGDGGSFVDVENTPGPTQLPPEASRLRYVMVRWDMKGGQGGSQPFLVHSRRMLKEDENGELVQVITHGCSKSRSSRLRH